MRTKRKLAIVLFALVGSVVTLAADANAIIGMPLTPLSFAGVARRSVRRAYWY